MFFFLESVSSILSLYDWAIKAWCIIYDTKHKTKTNLFFFWLCLKINKDHQLLFTHILQNIICVQQRKQTYTGGWINYSFTEFSFLGEVYHFKLALHCTSDIYLHPLRHVCQAWCEHQSNNKKKITNDLDGNPKAWYRLLSAAH